MQKKEALMLLQMIQEATQWLLGLTEPVVEVYADAGTTSLYGFFLKMNANPCHCHAGGFCYL